jgi:hypothetical protein
LLITGETVSLFRFYNDVSSVEVGELRGQAEGFDLEAVQRNDLEVHCTAERRTGNLPREWQSTEMLTGEGRCSKPLPSDRTEARNAVARQQHSRADELKSDLAGGKEDGKQKNEGAEGQAKGDGGEERWRRGGKMGQKKKRRWWRWWRRRREAERSASGQPGWFTVWSDRGAARPRRP